MSQRSVLGLVLTAAVLLVGLAPAAHAELRVGENFRLKSDPDPFRQKDALGLAVNPDNRQHIVSIVANYLDLRCEASVSRDGGDTWSPAVGLSPPAATPAFDERCNFFQSIEFGSGNNVYAAVTAGRVSPALSDSATLVYKSTNGGDTWAPAVVAMANGPGSAGPFGTNPNPGPSFIRPSLAVQAGVGAGGQDRVYVTALESTQATRTSVSGTVCTGVTGTSTCNRAIVAVSNDGGQTFPVQSAASPASTIITDSPSKPAINADGSVTVVWRTQGVSALLQSARSTDQGATWSAPKDIAKVVNTGTTVPSRTTPGPSSSASYPRMARDKTNGNLYLVYSQGSSGPNPPDSGYDAADHFISPDSAVYLQRSTTMGQTWTAPKLISDRTPYPGSRTVQTRHPSVSVSPGGRVDVVWHDRRHWFQGLAERNCTHSHVYCEDIRLSDTYYAYSDDNGNTFKGAGGVVGRSIRINDRSHNSDVGADTRPAGYWNYGPQAVSIGSGDAQRLLVGWMDSREGNWDTDTEDIYLAKVNHNASGDDPKTFVDDSGGAIAKSVRLSKIGYLAGNEGALVGGTRDPANAGVASPAGGPSSRNASAVVIVNENDLASAMAGTVLARANPAPVLLTGADLPTSVRDEITRLRPAAAYLVGDVSETVRMQVAAAAGILLAKVERLSGASPAATAALVAPKMDYRTAAEKTAVQPGFDAAVIANPTSPDTAAAVGLAAARRLPILYTTPDGAAVPPETSAALTALAIRSALVIGNADAVSSAVMTQMQALPEGAERLGGSDPVETSRAVVAESAETPGTTPTGRGLPSNIVYVADAANPMDATLLGGVMARATGILMLAAGPLYNTATTQAADFGLSSSRIDRFVILGPSSAPVVVTPPPATITPPPPADATPPPPPPAPATVTPPPTPDVVSTAKPALSRVSLTRRSFKARLGTSIRLTLSKDAKVRITVARRTIGRRIGRNCVALTPVTRRRAPCVRFVTRGTLTRSLKAGANTVRFTGRVAGRSLTPGRYRFSLRATDSANRRSNTINVTFTVVR